MIHPKKVKEILHQYAPEIVIKSLSLKQGDEYIVVEINKVWIFRFAKNQDTQQHLAIEVQLLKALENKISYPIPKVIYYFPNAYCFGYQKISGIPLTKMLFAQFTTDERKQFSQDFAQFLCELHANISCDNASKIGLTKSYWPLEPEILKIKLSNLDDIPLKEIFNQCMKDYQRIDAEKNLTVIHDDLHADNILIGTVIKRLAGIIDFTSAAIGNIYHEFRYLHLIDMELVVLAVQAYNQKSGECLNVYDAYVYCMATEFSRLSEAIEKKKWDTCCEIKRKNI